MSASAPTTSSAASSQEAAHGLCLTPAELSTVLAVLNRHLPGATVWAFGSRVLNWPGQRPIKAHSDLDLAIDATPLCSSPLAWAQARDALAESDLPWRVDATALADLPTSLRRLVQAQDVVISGPSSP